MSLTSTVYGELASGYSDSPRSARTSDGSRDGSILSARDASCLHVVRVVAAVIDHQRSHPT